MSMPQQQQQQQQQQQRLDLQYVKATLGWDLTLHPRGLDVAYWRERAPQFLQWDLQVILFLSVTLLALTLKFGGEMGVTRVTLSFGVAWLMCISWGALLLFPALYTPRRVMIVMAGRVVMAAASHLATNGVQEQLHKTLLFPSPILSLFFKIFLFCNTAQMPVESLRLQLPFLWQMVGTFGKAVALFCSEFTTEFVSFCNTPRYLEALQVMNSKWASMVQSGAPLHLPENSKLLGRSGSAVMAVTTVWITVVTLIGYLSYMSLWSDMRVWLATKVLQEGGSNDTPDTVTVNGVIVSRRQLSKLCQTPFAVLLTARGPVGTVATLLLHISIVNMLCMLSWVLSGVFVQHLLPALLPEHAMGLYYQELPCVDDVQAY